MAFMILLVLLFLPSVVLAQQDSSVLINEIAWMGSSVDGVDANQYWRYEWLELHNTKDVPFLLDGWNVELYRQDELYFVIPLAGTIFQGGYFLVAAHDKIPNADVNYANLGGKFLNNGMRVALKDGVGNIIDEIDAQDGWPAGNNETKRTMERTGVLQAETLAEAWQTSAKVGGTPKSQNSEGFKELVANLSSFANKKDPAGSFSKESVFSPPAFLAFSLALSSALLILLLRRVLARRA
ncbi:lamin tail domain-containing protein [Patescibacteria group bacterium]|nr:lamin tail domain-containing protein [Patescibacteria group bacterium]